MNKHREASAKNDTCKCRTDEGGTGGGTDGSSIGKSRKDEGGTGGGIDGSSTGRCLRI
ncbi:MAG: hypothetical protein Q4D40_05595 [Eubacteriales bacterium]|nr:hypothetical protein [Eubacteriales bacterium]